MADFLLATGLPVLSAATSGIYGMTQRSLEQMKRRLYNIYTPFAPNLCAAQTLKKIAKKYASILQSFAENPLIIHAISMLSKLLLLTGQLKMLRRCNAVNRIVNRRLVLISRLRNDKSCVRECRGRLRGTLNGGASGFFAVGWVE